jgi:hypothetical protein
MNRFFLVFVCTAIVFVCVVTMAADQTASSLVWPVATGVSGLRGKILGPPILVTGTTEERTRNWARACVPYKHCEAEPVRLDPGPWACLGVARMRDDTNHREYLTTLKASDVAEVKTRGKLTDVLRRHIAIEATFRGGHGVARPIQARKVRFVEWVDGSPTCARGK